ncbi:MAG: PhoX family phosphatase [Burkholderiaceae bacterium]
MTERNAPPQDPRLIDDHANTSGNPHFASVLGARLSRRGLLRGSLASSSAAVLGALGLSACGGDDDGPTPAPPPPAPAKLLGFGAVGKSLADRLVIPAGYSASVIYALGDPLRAGVPAYRNDGSDGDFDQRAGDHHDGMEWFGLGADGKRSDASTERGLLGINHEATTDEKLSSFYLHADGGTSTLPRPKAEVDKEVAVHGVAIVEVRKAGGQWAYVPDSAFNSRLTPLTEIELSGPARGNALLVTKYSAAGTHTRGTLNNCGTGKTPWGTLLTGEENWNGYFTRGSDDDAKRDARSVAALKRYGRPQGAASRHGWESAGTDDRYQRWDISHSGSSADGSDDYRHEMNAQGYIVEIDPYTKARMARKRTAMGRFAHESAAFSNPVAGQPLAVYMGDDARNEYIYKWVSAAPWSAADAQAADALAMGDKYLDAGRLYVAIFKDDGSGEWVELSISNPRIKGYAGYAFADQGDVCINARLAADAVGATRMDRPEWCSVNPANGEIYYTLTNNSNRSIDPQGSSQLAPDSANPRAYTDLKAGKEQKGNPNGHILRVREGAAGAAATGFTWDVYAFGAEAGADKSLVNLSGLTDEQDFSSPDGLAFSRATGILWLQTDDGAYTDVSNCMMLAALPGRVGDGGKKTLAYTRADGSKLNVDTYIGQAPAADALKRFLVGPKDCEITGIAETPDGKALFVNIQHPGEGTKMADIADPSKYTSQWPANAGYGAGQRPRSATIVITKDDGGVVGS